MTYRKASKIAGGLISSNCVIRISLVAGFNILQSAESSFFNDLIRHLQRERVELAFLSNWP